MDAPPPPSPTSNQTTTASEFLIGSILRMIGDVVRVSLKGRPGRMRHERILTCESGRKLSSYQPRLACSPLSVHNFISSSARPLFHTPPSALLKSPQPSASFAYIFQQIYLPGSGGGKALYLVMHFPCLSPAIIIRQDNEKVLRPLLEGVGRGGEMAKGELQSSCGENSAAAGMR